MKRILLFLALFITYTIDAQRFDDYKPLRSEGALPDDFTLRTSVKVATDISKEINSKDKSSVRKSKSGFLLKSNYMIDELLMSGRVLFGDPVSNYVNKVAAKVLESEPELKDELRFYCVKSNVTNAFTTNQGMIFVTLGLISQLENEAQLAYVIAHEITHYKRKHVINSYIESDRVFAQKGRYKYNNYDDNIIRLSNYSKKLEFESDSVGFYMLEKAGYNIKAAMSVFDVLQFSHLPYEEMEFDFLDFETENFKIPKSFILDTIVPIDFEGDYDDSKSSHPNVDKRRAKVRKFIASSKGDKKPKYLISEKEFFNVRELCRFEAIRLNLKSRNYVSAFYNAKTLQKEHPNSFFLKKSIGKALYGIYKYKSIDKYYKLVNDYTDYEGNISSAYYLFENLGAKQTGSMAVKYLWELYNESKDDYIKLILDDAINGLIIENDLTFEAYKTQQELEEFRQKQILDSLDAIKVKNGTIIEQKKTKEEEEEEGLSKYEKLRKIKQSQEEKQTEEIMASDKYNSDEFFLMAFVDVQNGEILKFEFEFVQSEIDAIQSQLEIENSKYDHLSDNKKRKAEQKDYKQHDKDILKIGAEKIVYVDPEYFVVDERKGVKLVNSEDKKFKFYDQIELVSDAADLEVEILSAKKFNSGDVDAYNNLATFNDWVGEQMDHNDIRTNWNIIPSETEFVIPVSENIGTEFISYSGVLIYKEKKDDIGMTLLYTIVLYPLLPFGIYYAVTPSYYSFYYTMVYNVKTGEKVIQKIYDMNKKANNGNINSFMYELMVNMKQQKGE